MQIKDNIRKSENGVMKFLNIYQSLMVVFNAVY